jgi:hypothetical protein
LRDRPKNKNNRGDQNWAATNVSETIFGISWPQISPARAGADGDTEIVMRLGELLIGQGLVPPEAVVEALKRQRQEGGRLGNHLVAMGALTVDQLVKALRGQREVDATLDMCARTLERWERTHGRNHPNTHRARYSYARTLLAAGRADEAARHAEAALAGFRATVGEQHAWTGDALQLVADARHAVSANEPQLEATAPAA